MKKVLFIIFAAVMLFCSCGKEDSENSAAEQVKTPVFGYIAFEELGEETFSDMEHVLSVIEKGPYPDADYIYLYVIDEAGRPVMNIQCFNPEQWAEYLENGISKGRALSMPGGLLPIKIPSYFSEEKLMTFTLVNVDIPGEPLVQHVTVNTEKLLDGSIYKVLWQKQRPEESVALLPENIKIKIETPESKDISRFFITVSEYIVPSEEGELSPAMGSADFDFSSENGFSVKNLSETEENPDSGKIYHREPRYIGSSEEIILRGENFINCDFIEITISESEGMVFPFANPETFSFIFPKQEEYSLSFE